MNEPSESRELDLVGKVEFRIALADSDAKLSNLLKTYLVPLLLKLASPSQAVRNKVINVCQHLNNRVKSPSIHLPVLALAKQFRDVDNALVRHFDLLYIQQSLENIDREEKRALFLEVLKALSVLEQDDPSSNTGRSTVFNVFLRLLPHFKLPTRGSKEDQELRMSLGLSAETWNPVAQWLTKLLLLEPIGPSPGLSQSEVDFLQLQQSPPYWAPGAGHNLLEVKVAAANFLASGAFADDERFISAVILSADNNATLSNIGDIVFKQHAFDLEKERHVNNLFELYFGRKEEPVRLPARPKLQIRILSLLSKSRLATSKTNWIQRLPQDELFGSSSARTNGLEGSKLRGQIFSFLNWTSRVGHVSSLKAIAPETVRDLREYIEHQGWPMPEATGTKLGPAEIGLRSQAYESIGILCPYAHAFEDLGLVRWLFTALRCDLTDSQIFVSIEGALGRALNALTQNVDQSLREELRSLLQWQMQAEIGQIDSDYGFETKRSTRFVAVRFANRCLPFDDVHARLVDLMAISTAQNRQELAEEGKKGLDPYQHVLLNPDLRSSFKLPPPEMLTSLFFRDNWADIAESQGRYHRALAFAVEFVRNITLASALAAKISVKDESSWDRKLDTLINNDEDARRDVMSYLGGIQSQSFVLLLKAALWGLISNQGRSGEYLVELLAFASHDQLEALTGDLETLQLVAMSNDRTNQRYAARALGIICSCTTVTDDQRKELTGKLPLISSVWRNAVGQQVSQLRGSVLVQAFVLTRLAWCSNGGTIDEAAKAFLPQILGILESRDLALREASAIALGEMMLCESNTMTAFAHDHIEKLIEGLMADARNGHEPAVKALGRLCYRLSDEKSSWQLIMERLRDLHEIRKPELHFAVGEALSVAVSGWHSKSLLTDFDVQAPHPKFNQPINGSLIASVMEGTIADCRNTKPSLRKAAAIWLLCLVQYCGHLEGAKQNLRKCQAAFAGLLSDRDEVVQESGSRGLGLVYEMGDETIKRDLVRDLVQSFTASGPRMGGKVEDDTVLFEEGALPTGDGSSVKTYGEVVKLAQEIGQPNLVYRFMNLAANNAIWSSRAAFGRFGLSNVLADSSILAENTSFYPKLYRYRFDPNPNVQRSMNDIWSALVKDTNAVLDEHFDTILQDLLKSIVSGEWRVREASCAAIADLLQGRDVRMYESYLDQIWTMAFKVGLDDIKETVRVAGMTLIRTLTNLLIRNLEVGDGGSNRAQTMLTHAIPFLIQQLQSGATQEIQQYAVATIVQITKKTPGKSLESFAPRLIETLIVSLSSLEPEIINYIHLNAAKYGLTSEKIDRARVSGMGTSPIMEAIERCLDGLTENSMPPSMNALESAMRAAIGLPSKVGCSRIIVTLCLRHTFTFRPYADRFAQLLRKQVLDRNETVSISYSMSLAYVTRLAGDKEMENIIAYVHRLYFESEEMSHRAVSGEIVQSISKISNDKFMHFATGFLPIAYIARHDSEEQVRELFNKTWQDNVGGSRAVVLYLQEIRTLAAQHIESPKWAVKHAAAKAIADLITSFDGTLDKSAAEGVWTVLEKALAGKTWDGKEDIVKVLPIFVIKAKSLWWEKKTEMTKIAIREAKRTNVNYRPKAIKSLGDFAREGEGTDLLTTIVDLGEDVVEELAASSDDKMDVDGDTSFTPRLREETASAILSAVLYNLSAHGTPDSSAADSAIDLVRKIVSIDKKATRQTLYEGAKIFFQDVTTTLTASPNEDGNFPGLRALSEKVLDVAVLETINEGAIEAELLRIKRSEVLLAFSTGAAVTRDRCTIITTQVQRWITAERSTQVRQLLEAALRALADKH